MSIITELLHGKITFTQAAAKAGQWASVLVSHDPALTAAAGEALVIVKQGASDAVMLGSTALAEHLAPMADTVEAALELALAKVTGGVSVPFNPLIDAGIDNIAGVAAKAIQAWALETKAALAQPAVPNGVKTLLQGTALAPAAGTAAAANTGS